MKSLTAPLVLAIVLSTTGVFGQEEAESTEEDLAKKLANPIASLISLPIQANYDEDYGPNEDGSVLRINVQPVIPFSLNEEWNIISRTIVPIIDQDDFPMNGDSETGMGDILQSLFFSPKKPTASGIVWGVGPAALLPTATDSKLGGEKLAIGPTAVALRQSGPWTYGGLVNHLESVAGDSDRAHISSTFLQPFVAYVTKTKTTFSLNTESTYDWRTNNWSIPINATVAQLFMVGKQPIQISAGPRFWAESPDNGPDGVGFRMQLTFLFPKK